VRLVYLGTPDEAALPLRALHHAGHEVALVVTQPDRRRGRGGRIDPSPVKATALELGLTVRTPERAREIVDDVAATGAEAGVVVAFGQLLPAALLAALPLGFVNVHFSLLPRWRGAAPVERAILADDAETGVCIMRVEEELDTGPIYAVVRTAIDPDETAGQLRARLVDLGTPLLLDVLGRFGSMTPQPQRGEPTYAEKLTVDDVRLDWRRAAAELARVVRAGNPRPGAWTVVDGARLKVLRAHPVSGADEIGAISRDATVGTGHGLLALDRVQPEGRRAMEGRAWRTGIHDERPRALSP
jgi:methionyl-tRNA formyltransferase